MKLDKRMRKIDIPDVGLIKWSAMFFALFVVSAWQKFAEFVVSTHWSWFLAASLTLAVRPIYRFFFKR